jgi:hypothetical protein
MFARLLEEADEDAAPEGGARARKGRRGGGRKKG